MPVETIRKFSKYTQDRIFKSIHGNNLIYNACWEDPRIDRRLLEFTKDSQVVMITSAGDNALDYLLDLPKEIHAVDVNPRQNALLELKKVLYRFDSYEDLFAMFGYGSHPHAREFYRQSLRPLLPNYAVVFWDQKIKYFEKDTLKDSFYYYGTSGNFAWILAKYLKMHKQLRKRVRLLINARDLQEQKKLYSEIEPHIWNFFIRWMMKRHITMAMLGVPRAQRQLIVDDYPDGLLGFLRNSLQHVFADIPLQDNYFWRAYLTGSYTEECCPQYLKKENFVFLQEHLDRLHLHTSTIADFLQNHPAAYSHYILLDHQDWLAWNNPQALEHEWKLIFKNSRSGTKVLLRSAALTLDFLPAFVKEKVDFDEELGKREHSVDRVGTYASTHIGTIK